MMMMMPFLARVLINYFYIWYTGTNKKKRSHFRLCVPLFTLHDILKTSRVTFIKLNVHTPRMPASTYLWLRTFSWLK